MEHPNLDALARRPAQYWTIDGLPELMLGLLWMVWGAAWLIGQQLPHDWRRTAYWLIVPPALALSGLAANTMTRTLKQRLTYPRTGYIAWPQPQPRVAFVVAGLTVLAAGTLAVFTLRADTAGLERRAPAVLSVIIALAFVALSVSRRTPHHLALAAAAVVLAVAVGAITSGWDAMNWLFIALGCVCAIVGGVRLAHFLRAHPLSPEPGA